MVTRKRFTISMFGRRHCFSISSLSYIFICFFIGFFSSLLFDKFHDDWSPSMFPNFEQFANNSIGNDDQNQLMEPLQKSLQTDFEQLANDNFRYDDNNQKLDYFCKQLINEVKETESEYIQVLLEKEQKAYEMEVPEAVIQPISETMQDIGTIVVEEPEPTLKQGTSIIDFNLLKISEQALPVPSIALLFLMIVFLLILWFMSKTPENTPVMNITEAESRNPQLSKKRPIEKLVKGQQSITNEIDIIGSATSDHSDACETTFNGVELIAKHYDDSSNSETEPEATGILEDYELANQTALLQSDLGAFIPTGSSQHQSVALTQPTLPLGCGCVADMAAGSTDSKITKPNLDYKSEQQSLCTGERQLCHNCCWIILQYSLQISNTFSSMLKALVFLRLGREFGWNPKSTSDQLGEAQTRLQNISKLMELHYSKELQLCNDCVKRIQGEVLSLEGSFGNNSQYNSFMASEEPTVTESGELKKAADFAVEMGPIPINLCPVDTLVTASASCSKQSKVQSRILLSKDRRRSLPFGLKMNKAVGTPIKSKIPVLEKSQKICAFRSQFEQRQFSGENQMEIN